MAAASQRKPKIKELNLSSDQLKLAKKFASDIGIGTTDEMYYYAILWYKNNLKPNGNIFSKTKQTRFEKELERRTKSKQYIGPVIKELLGKILLLSLQEQTDKDLPSQTQSGTAGQIRAATARVARTTRATPKRPAVTITIDKAEVEKGESYTVSWKSQNANFVSRSTQFTPTLHDVELSGSRTFSANRIGSKTFSITVRSLSGSSASARATINIVAVKDNPSAPQQTGSSSQTQQQTRRPRTTTTRVNRSSMRSSDTQLLNSINNSLKKIVDILTNQAGVIRAIEKKQKKDAENERRSKREGLLEMAKGAGGLLLEKALTPIKSIFEKIWRFIFFTLLGRAFTEFMNWFNDPKNKDKVKTLSRFLKDNFWLLIGGAALYFLTPFGGFVNSLIGKLAWYATKLIATKVLFTPAGLAALGVIGALAALAAGAYAYNQLPGQKEAAESFVRRGGKVKEGESLDLPGTDTMNDRYKSVMGGRTTPGLLEGASGGAFISNQTGMRIRGAGSDTQLTALTPGEIVMNKGAVAAVGPGNLLALNKMHGGANANMPKTLGNIFGMSGGGMVGNKNPKISSADYNALLAIASAEDFANPQGRADVAQSLYNRLHAANKYGENFLPTGGRNTLKDLITGQGQFQPTFGNRDDWLNITDRNSAANAFAKYKKIPVEQALRVLNDTDKILKNPVYQARAAKHVQGRSFFLGTSQQGNMKPGDVLRGKTHNFFSHWDTENSKYKKERGHIASPLPLNVMPSKPRGNKNKQGFSMPNLGSLIPNFSRPAAATTKSSAKPKGGQKPWWDLSRFMGKKKGGSIGGGLNVSSNMFSINGLNEDRFPTLLQAGEYVVPRLTVQKLGLQFFNDLVSSTDSNSEAAKISPIPRNESLMPPLPMSANMAQIMTLPPIMNSTGMKGQASASSTKIPSFPTTSPQSGNNRAYLAEIYGIG